MDSGITNIQVCTILFTGHLFYPFQQQNMSFIKPGSVENPVFKHPNAKHP